MVAAADDEISEGLPCQCDLQHGSIEQQQGRSRKQSCRPDEVVEAKCTVVAVHRRADDPDSHRGGESDQSGRRRRQIPDTHGGRYRGGRRPHNCCELRTPEEVRPQMID